MAMPITASEIAVGDWSPNYGTVTEIKENKSKDVVIGYHLSFFNGGQLYVAADYQLVIEQGGADIIHNGMPDKSEIRPGLKADHANG